MQNYKNIVFTILFITVLGSNLSLGQKTDSSKREEPKLIALTLEEQKLDIKNVLANQPSYIATEGFFFDEGFGGFSTSRQIAGKNNRNRIDTGFVTVISEPNKPDIRLYKNKTYEIETGVRKVFVTPSAGINPVDLLSFDDITFNALGAIVIDGHKCLKIEAKSNSFSPKVFLYVAEDLKNLVMATQIISERQSSIQKLVKISFDVTDDFFNIPADYKELSKYKWDKVKTANVYYKGNLVKNALVFRHENYLFIHVAEFEHFYIDLNKKIADTVVFQGLLVANNGAYIWRTNENEAISVGELEDNIKAECDSCVKIKDDKNSLDIPNPKNTAKTLVKITW